MAKVSEVGERDGAVSEDPWSGGERKRRRRGGERSIVWHEEDQQSARQRADGSNHEHYAPSRWRNRPPHEMRTCRAECERPHKNADRQPSSFFKPARGDLHTWRIDASERGASQEPTPDPQPDAARCRDSQRREGSEQRRAGNEAPGREPVREGEDRADQGADDEP